MVELRERSSAEEEVLAEGRGGWKEAEGGFLGWGGASGVQEVVEEKSRDFQSLEMEEQCTAPCSSAELEFDGKRALAAAEGVGEDEGEMFCMKTKEQSI